MPRMMPNIPEGRTYEEYEEQRDDALKLPSIYKGKPYTVRLRTDSPTRELFAYDKTSLITSIKLLGKYSLLQAKVAVFDGIRNDTFAVNEQGIIFNPENLPFDLHEVPYKAERGYFVGDTGDIGGGEASETEFVEMQDDEVIELRRHLALTR